MRINDQSKILDDSNLKIKVLGFWSAVVMTIAVIVSGITASAALKIPSLISGILLIPVFILLMACIHENTPSRSKTFSLLGQVFTIGYAVLIGFNYFMQLTLVNKNLYSDVFDMHDPQSIFSMIELLGYGFMGLATLSTSFAFTTTKLQSVIRYLFILNGILGIGGMIGYAFGLSWSVLTGGLIIWDIIMPISSILLAIMFRNEIRVARRS